ncbi:hypothetical protein [Gilliamella sp. B2838]|uniref:hypothetical protein n=1 Tax=Gilliamella sp. B2838 TaxID=2818020 RepID=UPI00226A3034|nr:hypothetical protein [Gilliamella sp. B2838]MCX8727181.1 hypothetical protein [Gilliamella sp. B2838]
MPITQQDIKDHNDYYDITKFVGDMTNSEYKEFLNKEAFFYADAHGFVRHVLSDEPVATNKDQLDLLIEHLKSYRAALDEAHPKYHKG